MRTRGLDSMGRYVLNTGWSRSPGIPVDRRYNGMAFHRTLTSAIVVKTVEEKVLHSLIGMLYHGNQSELPTAA